VVSPIELYLPWSAALVVLGSFPPWFSAGGFVRADLQFVGLFTHEARTSTSTPGRCCSW
jgi:hypothetical protein